MGIEASTTWMRETQQTESFLSWFVVLLTMLCREEQTSTMTWNSVLTRGSTQFISVTLPMTRYLKGLTVMTYRWNWMSADLKLRIFVRVRWHCKGVWGKPNNSWLKPWLNQVPTRTTYLASRVYSTPSFRYKLVLCIDSSSNFLLMSRPWTFCL